MNKTVGPASRKAPITRVIGLAGWSGAGKTTLLTRLIPLLAQDGYTVSTLKHAHHAFDVDTPGKDSHRHRQAGAQEVLVVSEMRWALMHEMRGAKAPPLAELLVKLAPVDLVIIEGFKAAPYPKIEVYRAANGKPHLYPQDAYIVALASDGAESGVPLTVIPLDDTQRLAQLVLDTALDLALVLERLQAEAHE